MSKQKMTATRLRMKVQTYLEGQVDMMTATDFAGEMKRAAEAFADARALKVARIVVDVKFAGGLSDAH